MSPVARERLLWLGVGVLAFGLSQTGSPPLGHLNASVSQALLKRDWSAPVKAGASCQGRSGGSVCPVARLSIPGQRAARIVLRQSSDRAPAGGWGHLAGTPLPGTGGNTVFRVYTPEDGALLQQLRRGDTLVVELSDARQFAYRVTVARVADRRAVRVDYETDGADLTLISRQPGDLRGDMRLVVNAALLPAPLMARLHPALEPPAAQPPWQAPPA